jgi:hypothetical protein
LRTQISRPRQIGGINHLRQACFTLELCPRAILIIFILIFIPIARRSVLPF